MLFFVTVQLTALHAAALGTPEILTELQQSAVDTTNCTRP
jgi:hypothetical protein